MFSPNSQRIFFQSDRDGKMAIYAMAVERLVEATEADVAQVPDLRNSGLALDFGDELRSRN
jgi:hypothetical protein